MKDVVLAFVTGAACGTVFAFWKLPIPAPPGLAGVAGVFGITLAFIVVEHIRS